MGDTQYYFLVEYIPGMLNDGDKSQLMQVDLKNFIIALQGGLVDRLKQNIVIRFCTLDTLEFDPGILSANADKPQLHIPTDITSGKYTCIDGLMSSSVVFWGTATLKGLADPNDANVIKGTAIGYTDQIRRTLRGLVRYIFYPYADEPIPTSEAELEIQSDVTLESAPLVRHMRCDELDGQVEGVPDLHVNPHAAFRWKAWALRSSLGTNQWVLDSTQFFNGAGGGDRR